MAENMTGDATKGASVKNIALTVGAPIVAKADLLNTKHMINQKAQSGKAEGSFVIVKETHSLAIASGAKATDTWKVAGVNLS